MSSLADGLCHLCWHKLPADAHYSDFCPSCELEEMRSDAYTEKYDRLPDVSCQGCGTTERTLYPVADHFDTYNACAACLWPDEWLAEQAGLIEPEPEPLEIPF